MKLRFPVLLAALAIASPLAAQAAQTDRAPQHRHHHGHATSQPAQLNAGQKWAADEHLRVGMSRINEAMTVAMPQIHEERFSQENYQDLATTVSEEVSYIVAHCKLEPAADAALHRLLADLLDAAEMMKHKFDDTRHDGAAKVKGTLDAYGKTFKHPGWAAVSCPRKQ